MSFRVSRSAHEGAIENPRSSYHALVKRGSFCYDPSYGDANCPEVIEGSAPYSVDAYGYVCYPPSPPPAANSSLTCRN